MKTLSMKKRTVDFAALIAKDPKKRAVGNASMNAHGDIIKKNGKIVKTREQIMTEYNQSHPQTVKSVGIKNLSSETYLTPAEAVAQVRQQQQVLQTSTNPPIAASSNPRKMRKLQDSE